MSTEKCTTGRSKKKAISYGEILKELPSRSRDLVTAEYRKREGSLDAVDRQLLARSVSAVEDHVEMKHPLWPERTTLRDIRRSLEV